MRTDVVILVRLHDVLTRICDGDLESEAAITAAYDAVEPVMGDVDSLLTSIRAMNPTRDEVLAGMSGDDTEEFNPLIDFYLGPVGALAETFSQ